MPEAAVYEDRNLSFGPCEIGLASNGPVLAVTLNSSGAKYSFEWQFGGCIPARANSCHYLRTHEFGYVIHYCVLILTLGVDL